MRQITAMYFSPTGTSRKATTVIAASIGKETGYKVTTLDLTKPAPRTKEYTFGEDDILVLGYPVYAGRVPNVLQDVFKKIKGSRTQAVIVAVYGNRAYEDAVLEAKDILTDGGFVVVGAGAFIGEHSYSKKVATGRPDERDIEICNDFGKKISAKLANKDFGEFHINGNRPYKDPMPNMPFKPKTTEACTDCGVCTEICPMQVISKEDPQVVNDGCILCSACVKGCPVEAKYIDAEPLNKIKAMLEANCGKRKEVELFL
ncbi:MAG: EFR1 family ferrodoxin [Anaerovoracaceae bacterium]